MDKRKKIPLPEENQVPKIDPEINPLDIDEPIPGKEDPDVIPEEDPFENPPDEPPVPGEGP